MNGLRVLELQNLPKPKHSCYHSDISVYQGQVITVTETLKPANETISKLKFELKLQFSFAHSRWNLPDTEMF